MTFRINIFSMLSLACFSYAILDTISYHLEISFFGSLFLDFLFFLTLLIVISGKSGLIYFDFFKRANITLRLHIMVIFIITIIGNLNLSLDPGLRNLIAFREYLYPILFVPVGFYIAQKCTYADLIKISRSLTFLLLTIIFLIFHFHISQFLR